VVTNAQLSAPIPRHAILALLRTVGLIILTLILFPPALLTWALGLHRARKHVVRWFYAVARRMLNVHVQVRGHFHAQRPLLLVANHASYLDVIVLGSQLPVAFTPKREVRSWPVIGFFCVLADCVFVERKRSNMQEAQTTMAAKLNAGRTLCIFPEGTTNNGREMKSFKSGFFNLAELFQVPVQPVTISYLRASGVPLTEANSDQVAWVGDATFFGHFANLLGFSSIQVVLTLHPALLPAQFADRKALAITSEQCIRAQLLKDIAHAG
jgi:lyso-ornithine lipid O-acyltransferase